MSVRDISVGETFDIKFSTRAFASGAPTTLAGTPAISAYPGNSVTQLTAGITLTVDFDGVTGLHNVRVVATTGNGYATATDYALVITTGTVGGVSVVGEVIGEFTIGRSAAATRVGILTDTASTGDPGTTVSAVAYLKQLVNVLVGTNGVTTWAAGSAPASAVSLSEAIRYISENVGAAGAGLTAVPTVATVTNLTNLPTIPTNWLTAAGIAATALNGKGDWNIGKTGYGLTVTTGLGNQTANITGDLSGSVGSVTGAVGSVTGAVGSVTGAVGSVTGAVGSVTGAVGSVTGSVGSLGATAKADVNAEVVDALATDTYAEPGQGTPAATATLAAKINYLFKAWRNRGTQTASQYSLYNDDAVTVDQKATFSDDATTADRGEIATGP